MNERVSYNVVEYFQNQINQFFPVVKLFIKVHPEIPSSIKTKYNL